MDTKFYLVGNKVDLDEKNYRQVDREDVEELRNINIGIKAVGVHPMKSEKRGLGEIGVNLKFGGVTFLPGYFVYCDANGVIVSKTNLT